MNTAQFERIEAYLQNRLSEAERQAFEVEIRANSALQAEVEAQQKLRLGLRAMAIEKNLRNAKKRTQTKQIKMAFWGKSQWQTWAAAASIIVVLGVSWWGWNYDTAQNENQFMALAEKEMIDVQYKSLPFESLQNLSKAAPTRNAREKAEWYVALVYLKKGKNNEAKVILKRIANEPKHLYHSQAKKTLAKW
jgi:hypothetical protein